MADTTLQQSHDINKALVYQHISAVADAIEQDDAERVVVHRQVLDTAFTDYELL